MTSTATGSWVTETEICLPTARYWDSESYINRETEQQDSNIEDRDSERDSSIYNKIRITVKRKGQKETFNN